MFEILRKKNVKSELFIDVFFVCAGALLAQTQQTQNICITFVQRRPNVFAVVQHCINFIQMSCVCWNVGI